MKTMIAMMLAGAFLIARPALAGDEKPKDEKSEKAGKAKKGDKKDQKAAEPAPADKKTEKGGW
jgi:hypothetical protein